MELFSGPESTGGSEPRVSGAFLRYLRIYEKTVLLVILLLAVAVLSYIAGVEKGRNSALKNAAARGDRLTAGERVSKTAAERRPAAAITPPKPVPAAPAAAVKTAPAPRISGKFTVQLASYRYKEQALKEARLLQKRGLAPAVLYLKPYYVLCSGSFQEKRTAELWRLKLKKQYRDCYVRRL